MNTDCAERFWEVCDDMGYNIDMETVRSAWETYCTVKGVSSTSTLPVKYSDLVSVVNEAMEIWREHNEKAYPCTGGSIYFS